MRYLFIHQNCPAQFGLLAAYLSDIGHDVVFVSLFGGYEQVCPNIKHIRIDRSDNKNSSSGLNTNLSDAELFLKTFISLDDEGWIPDYTISHSGWACGYYVKDVFPSTFLLSYIEWYHSARSFHLLSDVYDGQWAIFPSQHSYSQRLNSLFLASECCEADLCIAPTIWQSKTLPASLLNQTHILHEGIDDTGFSKFSNNLSDKPILTYAARGFEAIRGFPDFIQCLPVLDSLIDYPVKLFLLGGRKVHYGLRSRGISSTPGAHHKWASDFLNSYNLRNIDVRFLDPVPLKYYLRILARSNIFVYPSLPYIPSWGFLQAALCNRHLVVHSNDMTTTLLHGVSNCTYFSSFSPSELASSISRSIESFLCSSTAPNSSKILSPNHSFPSVLPRWVNILSS